MSLKSKNQKQPCGIEGKEIVVRRWKGAAYKRLQEINNTISQAVNRMKNNEQSARGPIICHGAKCSNSNLRSGEQG